MLLATLDAGLLAQHYAESSRRMPRQDTKEFGDIPGKRPM